jgi:hypothetical protein
MNPMFPPKVIQSIYSTDMKFIKNLNHLNSSNIFNPLNIYQPHDNMVVDQQIKQMKDLYGIEDSEEEFEEEDEEFDDDMDNEEAEEEAEQKKEAIANEIENIQDINLDDEIEGAGKKKKKQAPKVKKESKKSISDLQKIKDFIIKNAKKNDVVVGGSDGAKKYKKPRTISLKKGGAKVDFKKMPDIDSMVSTGPGQLTNTAVYQFSDSPAMPKDAKEGQAKADAVAQKVFNGGKIDLIGAMTDQLNKDLHGGEKKAKKTPKTKRAPSAYNLFVQDYRTKNKVSFKDAIKQISGGKLWKK